MKEEEKQNTNTQKKLNKTKENTFEKKNMKKIQS